MAASCSVVCCGHEEDSDKAAIFRFSNGNVLNAEKLDFTMYTSADKVNPRKKSRRILVAESDRLSYVGQNFGTGGLKCNTLCNYYVGVLNKETMQMELHRAQLFNLQPIIPGEKTAVCDQAKTETYREKVDSLIEAFGTNKQKKALSSRRLNHVDHRTLHQAVGKAASAVIDEKGLHALQQEVAEMESEADFARHLPPCDPHADTPENVYPLDELLGPVDFKALEEAGSKMAALTAEELQTMRESRGLASVLKHLENPPSTAEGRQKMARCAFYLSLLLKLSRQKNVNRKFGVEEGCPRIVQNKLFRKFTVETFTNGRVQNMVSTSMRVKLATYCLALLLHMGDMTADLTLLHQDMGLTEAKIIEVAKSMGLTLAKPPRGKKAVTGLQEEHKRASLVLPLVKHDTYGERRKRKRMH
ncbi:DNA-directed RNA polymerase I subunit RPA49 [Syngnathoides biaculeatus]|uniref:DNA-directed RNA polymerase I subunit RPA49 n=1 Tax=Syngnathoides biaculeatus TaxID=300417 RepID=UPI002ADE72D2|nr:DNA-directed RNA polymerase I subunit RPA49 [Syngnathoides biaculeatus]XP_061687035.1 DNA-directed RNA polymerase I subunit RPA49 [Syngnathoides biaculeatus]XP_061687036.1 DNA-directed RNA polymerase I subunit RPA49 [Syngnathoides biaculeatus]XP_061687037.1 DNA-directed RNA polymerase I subunit RPA49 [Syngnathoides biaculeatus]